MRRIRYPSAFLLLLAVLTSCSLQKRNYLRGYYISWNKTHYTSRTNPQELSAISKSRSMNRVEARIPGPTNILQPHLTAAKLRPYIKKGPDTCDTLVLQNGTEIKVKVIEIDPDEIKYKYCNNPGGPLIIISKNDVKLIKYANGEKEEFTLDKNSPDYHYRQKMDELYLHKQAQSALVNGIVSFIIGYFGVITAATAIIRGRRVLRMLGNDPMMHMRLYKQARAGVILGIIYFSLVAFVILIGLAIALSLI